VCQTWDVPIPCAHREALKRVGPSIERFGEQGTFARRLTKQLCAANRKYEGARRWAGERLLTNALAASALRVMEAVGRDSVAPVGDAVNQSCVANF